MEIKIHTQQVDISAEREAYIRAKFEKITHWAERLSDESVEIKVDLIHQAAKKPEDVYECHLTLFVPGETLRAEAHSDSLENAVDEVIEKIKAPIQRYKDKMNPISGRE